MQAAGLIAHLHLPNNWPLLAFCLCNSLFVLPSAVCQSTPGINPGSSTSRLPSQSPPLHSQSPPPPSQITPPPPPSQSLPPAQAPAASSTGFVTTNGTQLQLNGSPFYFCGANFYSAMVDAAGSSTTRPQVTAIFQTMQNLGMTVLRTWAFNDLGVNNTWQALQIAPEVFDETVFSNGLDWIISEAPKYGIKLLLTLTNYQQGYGGAYQYVQWANGTSILDFYTNPTILGWYQNNIKTIVTRKNSITGISYMADPAIFGWELINEPSVPGDDSGTVLTNWIDTNSAYLKGLDSNHLVAVGVEGFYGSSTPDRLPDNPSPSLSSAANGGNPAPYAAICEGQDFTANHMPQGIDVTMIHLYPDYWATGNLSFQLTFTAQFLSGHMSESLKLQKPLIIGEFGKYPPLADRNTYLSYIYSIAAASAASGGVLAGTMVWTLGTSPEYPYVQGFDAFNIYPDAAPYSEPPPAGYVPPTHVALANAEIQEFYGWANQTACNAKYVTAPKGLLNATTDPSNGWNDTLTIIASNARAMAAASSPTTPSTLVTAATPSAASG